MIGANGLAGRPDNRVDVEYALEHLILEYRREFMAVLANSGIELSPAEIRVLRLLHRSPGCSLQHLVQCTGRDKAQVTRRVRALEERKLVRRERDVEDQRSFRLYLTDEGSGLEKRMRAVRATINRKLFSRLDAGEREQLRRLLNLCIAALVD